MRSIFLVFLTLSLLLHLLFLGLFHLDKFEKKEEKPIEVSIVPKEKKAPQPAPLPAPKPAPTPIPEPKPVPKPAPQPQQKQPDYRNLPMDDDLPTDFNDKGPALKEQKPKQKQSDKAPAQKKGQDKQPQKQQPAPPQVTPDKDAQLQKNDKTNLPKISSDTDQKLASSKEAQQKRLDDILNPPKDIIDKYAKGDSDVTGEDSVSMQYVKMKYQSYFHKFSRMLYQVWQYPVSAGMRGEQGLVHASFVISKEGKISSIRILESSGYPDLDNEVLYALKHMSAVPLPESYKLEVLNVDAYFKYVISSSRITIY